MQSYINVRGESLKKRVLPDFQYHNEIKGNSVVRLISGGGLKCIIGHHTGAHARLKYWLRKLVAFLFSQVGVGAVLMLYTVLGATIFISLESSSHEGLLKAVENQRAHTVVELWKITHNYNVIYTDRWATEVDLIVREFQKTFLQHVKSGYRGEKDEPWTFPKAVMYSLSVYTTIGWGNIFPMTAWGKAVTCIYALIGIPLLLLYMANIGDLLARSFIGIYVSVERCKKRLERFRMERDAITIGHAEEGELTVIDHYVGGQKDKTLITQMRNQDNNKWRTNEMTTMIPISTCLFVFCCYIVLGAVIFSWWEGWDYLEGSYFCFISLVTIGFGDLVPGYRMGQSAQQTVDGQLILCSIYILFGMGLMYNSCN